MLTRQQVATLETAYEILDKLRHCKAFNESHDLSVADGCQVLSDFLDYAYEQERASQSQIQPTVNLSLLESFQNL